MSKSIKFKDNTYLDSSSVAVRGNGFNLNSLYNKMSFGSDVSSWLPSNLVKLNAKKIFSSNSMEGIENEGEFGIAYHDRQCFPFTDGAFYQGEDGNKVLDESIFVKIWEDTNVTGWHEANLGTDISPYKFVIICASNMCTIVPSENLSLNLTWCGWLEELQKDVVVNRAIWRDGNDIHWGPAYYYAVNGFNGFGQIDNINFPKMIYGVRV